MLGVVSIEVEREPLGRPQIDGIKPSREYVFCDRGLHYALLYHGIYSPWVYFVQSIHELKAL